MIVRVRVCFWCSVVGYIVCNNYTCKPMYKCCNINYCTSVAFSQEDVDELTKLEQVSTRCAVFRLLVDIGRRREDWLSHFLIAMDTTNNKHLYKYLIENIEPKLTKAGSVLKIIPRSPKC